MCKATKQNDKIINTQYTFPWSMLTLYMLEFKFDFTLKFFNLGWFLISFVL